MRYSDDGNMSVDYGYFGRFPNPLNPKSRVVIVHGIHTFGVLGAVLSFSDRNRSENTVRNLVRKIGSTQFFESILTVEVVKGVVIVTDPKDIVVRSVGPAEKTNLKHL